VFTTEHVVLVVDDEPDVLAITKLALRHMTVFGIPLKVYTAPSKAEAISLLESLLMTQHGINIVAVALIDVVMESDAAGLELCQYIREEMGNNLTRLYIRTGQPGLAPERTVIDQYDITGYFTKVETTEDKLYSLVKSGIREYLYSATAQLTARMIQSLIAAHGSQEYMSQILTYVSQTMSHDATGTLNNLVDVRFSYIVDGEVIGGVDSGALDLEAELSKLPATKLSEEGDKFVVDDNWLMIKIAETPFISALTFIAVGTAPSPEFEIKLYYQLARSIAGLWYMAR
jgi:CheY-like chemotaxis protein